MEIYLIRHTTPLITKGLIYGRMDVPLASSFTQEKEIILEQLPLPFDAVYSSPSARCSQLALDLSKNYLKNEALYELDFGEWEGKTWETIDRLTSEVWMNDFVNLAPPNGENMLQMQERVMLFWNWLLQQPHQKVAVVTHGGVIRIILAHYRSLALKDSFTIKVNFAEVIRLTASGLAG